MGGSNGGSSDPTGNAMTNQQISKAKSDTARRSMAQSGVQDPYEFTRLTENLQAQKLEREAETKNFLGQPRGTTIGLGPIKVSPSSLVPGGLFLNKMQEFSYKQQARELRRGGTIVKDEFGDYAGVIRDGQYSGKAEYDPTNTMQGDDNDTTTPEVTPERTSEIVPDDKTLQTKTIMEQATRGTRRTRRAGQAGTIIEGYGALTRGKGSRSVV